MELVEAKGEADSNSDGDGGGEVCKADNDEKITAFLRSMGGAG